MKNGKKTSDKHRTNSHANKPGDNGDIHGAPLPTALELSMLATQPRFAGLVDQTEALKSALSTWITARWVLARQETVEAWRTTAFAYEKVRPRKWPATFDDFLRLVVRGKDKGERLATFRRFLDARQRDYAMKNCNDEERAELLTPESLLDGQQQNIARYVKTKFNILEWDLLAYHFCEWRAKETKAVRKLAGQAGAAAAKSAKAP